MTDWRVLGRGDGLTWLEMRPRTGRTHQIRVHCAVLGTPILGDARYGGGDGALHLLARSIHLPLEPPVDAVAPPPAHMLAALERAGFVRRLALQRGETDGKCDRGGFCRHRRGVGRLRHGGPAE